MKPTCRLYHVRWSVRQLTVKRGPADVADMRLNDANKVELVTYH